MIADLLLAAVMGSLAMCTLVVFSASLKSDTEKYGVLNCMVVSWLIGASCVVFALIALRHAIAWIGGCP